MAIIARSMAQWNQQEIAKLNEKIASMTDGDELSDLSSLKEKKIDKGHAINRVLLHPGEFFAAYGEQARMFDVRDALTELTGVLSRGTNPGEAINIARSYGREMYVLTILQRTGDVKPITLNVLSTVRHRLKGKGGTTFGPRRGERAAGLVHGARDRGREQRGARCVRNTAAWRRHS